jgi:hypothetical protein
VPSATDSTVVTSLDCGIRVGVQFVVIKDQWIIFTTATSLIVKDWTRH